MSCVQALSDASQQAVWPEPQIREREERAFGDLVFVRQALLDALYAHCRRVATRKTE